MKGEKDKEQPETKPEQVAVSESKREPEHEKAFTEK